MPPDGHSRPAPWSLLTRPATEPLLWRHQAVALLLLTVVSFFVAFFTLLSLHRSFRARKRTQGRTHSRTSPQDRQRRAEALLAESLFWPQLFVRLLRSFDSGALLGLFFLVLLPELRSTFEFFVEKHLSALVSSRFLPGENILGNVSALNATELRETDRIEETFRQEALRSVSAQTESFLSKLRTPLPLVELILCLSFFALHFLEEFVQIVFRYRRHFWSCNSSVLYSSSRDRCPLTALDYRISRTKRFLIDCSRKTSTVSETTNRTDNVTHNPLLVRNGFADRVSDRSIIDIDDDNQRRLQDAPSPELCQTPNHLSPPSRGLESIAEVTDETDDDQSGPSKPSDCSQDSLISECSSVRLPSYYWDTGQKRRTSDDDDDDGHQHPKPNRLPQPHPLHICCNESLSLLVTQLGSLQSQSPSSEVCWPCHVEQVLETLCRQQQQRLQQTNTGLRAVSTPNVFTKIFLPFTSLATSTPALYLCEGALVALQPSVALLWIALGVVLLHKLVLGLSVSLELHEKTGGRQRHWPNVTAVLYTLLPIGGFLLVCGLDAYSVLLEDAQDDTSRSLRIRQLLIAKLVILSLCAGSSLHLVLLVAQRSWNALQPSEARINTTNSSNLSANESFESNARKTGDSPSPSVFTSPSSSAVFCPHSAPNTGQPNRFLERPRRTDLELVTDPPRFSILHHFTMYSGFVAVLLTVAAMSLHQQ